MFFRRAKARKARAVINDKGKGNQRDDKGKGKGKPSDKGKGKSQKGQQKGYNSGYNVGQQQKGKLDANVCAYCGKHGHWQRESRKKQADQQNQVRVVGATDSNDSKQDTQATAASFSTGSGSQAVRLVSMHASQVGSAVVEDLTLHSCPTSPTSLGSVRMLQACLCSLF